MVEKGTESVEKPSSCRLVLGFLLYVLAFAVPTVALVLLIPKYAPWFALAGIVAFFTVSAFTLGWQWQDPRWTRETRGYVRNLLIGLAVVTPAGELISKHTRDDVLIAALLSVGFLAITLLPFFLGRWLWYKRNRLQSPFSSE